MSQAPDQAKQMRVDLHIHTSYSDNFSTPLEILHIAAKRGLDAVAITDHDTIEGALEAAAAAQADKSLPAVIVGEEVSSASGHILGLFLTERVAPHQSAQDTVAAIHAQGGLAIAAHPLWRVGLDSVGTALLDSLPFDGLEVNNGAPVPSMRRANRKAVSYHARSTLAATGGSDAHHALAVGWSHTRFAGSSVFDLRSAILLHSTFPGHLRINPIDFVRYALYGLLRRPHALFRVAF